MTTSTVAKKPVKSGRSLVPADLFDRLTGQIRTKHPELTADMPERILDQALAFLGTCAVATRRIGPSELVDIGWHTFILNTVDYLEFCDSVAGRFIHHVPETEPEDRPAKPVPPSTPVALADTITAVRAAGYAIDLELWRSDRADCSKCTQCHAGCTDSPRR